MSMDMKIEPSVVVAKRKFLTEFKEELKKVTWTEKRELISSTKIVVAVTFSLGMGIYFVDLAIKSFLNAITYAAHLVGF